MVAYHPVKDINIGDLVFVEVLVPRLPNAKMVANKSEGSPAKTTYEKVYAIAEVFSIRDDLGQVNICLAAAERVDCIVLKSQLFTRIIHPR